MRERYPCAAQGCDSKGPFSFAKENGPFGTPRERLLIGSLRLEQVFCLRNATALRAALPRWHCYTFASASIIRCRSAYLVECAVITVYRGTHQCGERSNAAFGRQSAAEQTSLAPHGSKARLRVVTRRRGSWRSHVHRTRLRSVCNSSRLRLPMCGVEGEGPSSFLLGDQKGDILFPRKRISPFNALPHGAGFPRRATRGVIPASRT